MYPHGKEIQRTRLEKPFGEAGEIAQCVKVHVLVENLGPDPRKTQKCAVISASLWGGRRWPQKLAGQLT